MKSDVLYALSVCRRCANIWFHNTIVVFFFKLNFKFCAKTALYKLLH